MVGGAVDEPLTVREREFWLLVRQALLLFVDAIERRLNWQPRTAALRHEAKEPPSSACAGGRNRL